MKFSQRLLGAATVVVFAIASPSHASDIKVIANSSVRADTISAAELKRIFLKEKISLADGTHVEPVFEKGGLIHETFLQEYLGVSDDDLQNYYRTLLFTGRGSIPKAFASDAKVVAYVARTRGSIGYVSNTSNAEGVNTLVIGVPGDNVERKLLTWVEPDYPETLKQLKISGTVRLRITISPKGTVENVELLGGSAILGESATAAVKKWVYAAGRSRTFLELSIPFGESR
jgi:TonB family protein